MNGRNNLISLGSVWLRRVIRRIRRRRPINNTLSIPCSKCVNRGRMRDCVSFLASKTGGARGYGWTAPRTERGCGRLRSEPTGRRRGYRGVSRPQRSLAPIYIPGDNQLQRVISRNGRVAGVKGLVSPPSKKKKKNNC